MGLGFNRDMGAETDLAEASEAKKSLAKVATSSPACARERKQM